MLSNHHQKMRLRVRCPAKVNLFLAVGPKDARGYHPLRTIFQAIDLCDELEIEIGGPGAASIEVDGAELPAENTLTKTLRLSGEIFALNAVSVRLTKTIPLQAGLGGGSSDAAGILRAFNSLRPVSRPEMESVASAVGADVPFFLTGGRARGEGYGDRVQPLPDEPEDWYVIAKPPIGCSTPEMYARLDESPRDWGDWPPSDRLYNDFERVAPPECLDLIDQLLGHGARDAALCGSGSAVFGRCGTRGLAEEVAGKLRGNKDLWVARTLTRSESLHVSRVADSPT